MTRPVVEWNWFVKIVRWVDGDTVYVDIDRGFRDWSRRGLRLFGINTPEMRGPTLEAARISRERVMELAPVGTATVIQTYKPTENSFHHVSTTWTKDTDSFGRWLAVIWPSDERYTDSINDILMEEGLAKEY